jgi:5-methylcytosine-specific restriction endonuclease McrBC GTP-binding regulatory subunit McrB
MKILISENKIEQLKIFVQEILDDELNNLRQMADDEWGLGEMDEINEVSSVENIVVDEIKTTDGISVNINLYLNGDREEFDNIFAMIEYVIEQWFPNAEIHIEKVYI